jgi:hypothetical protein
LEAVWLVIERQFVTALARLLNAYLTDNKVRVTQTHSVKRIERTVIERQFVTALARLLNAYLTGNKVRVTQAHSVNELKGQLLKDNS